MNQGFYTTFSSNTSFDPSYTNVSLFDINGVYSIEQGVKMIFIVAVGGGGGGGGGGKYANGTFSGGGGGGGGGSFVRAFFLTEDLGGFDTSLNITIGSGGTGGAGPAGTSTNGSTGNTGGATIIDVNGCGTIIAAPGGAGGTGGSVSGNVNGGLSIGFLNYGFYHIVTRAGNGCANTPAAGGSITVQDFRSSFGGGGGGGRTAANAILSGGSISAFTASDPGVMNPNIPLGTTFMAAGSTDGQNGESNLRNWQPFGLFSPGLGGAGGAGGFVGNAGNGGNGYRGGGGGGGGGGTNGLNSGTGGTGGNGYVAILAIRG